MRYFINVTKRYNNKTISVGYIMIIGKIDFRTMIYVPVELIKTPTVVSNNMTLQDATDGNLFININSIEIPRINCNIITLRCRTETEPDNTKTYILSSQFHGYLWLDANL